MLIKEEGHTYLFDELAATNHERRAGLVDIVRIVVISARMLLGLFQVPWHNELEFPRASLPDIIYTGHPASCSIGRRRRCICMRYAL